MTDWTEKYRPDSISDVVGNNSQCQELQRWAEDWTPDDGAVILHGRPGVGKTSAAHALAEDKGWETMEMNASDSRTGDVVDRVAGEASKTGTLTGGIGSKRLVIIDEADNFHGNIDRGGTRAISQAISSATQPVILIANDYYEMSDSLKNKCTEIEFDPVSTSDVIATLEDVCENEGKEFERDALREIATKTDGDVRSALNDLQAVATGTERITAGDLSGGSRDRETGIFDFLGRVIQDGSPEDVHSLSREVDNTPDTLTMWVEHNVLKKYNSEEAAEAYDHLSRADNWHGRVIATQNYSYWKYASVNLSSGVAAARSGRKGGWVPFNSPYGRYYANGSSRKKSAAESIADKSEMASGSSLREVISSLQLMVEYCKPRDLTTQLAAYYDLDESEVAAVTGSGKSTNKVQSLVENAEEIQSEFEIETPENPQTSAHKDEQETENKMQNKPPQTNMSDSPTDDEENDKTDSSTDESGGDDQAGLSEFM